MTESLIDGHSPLIHVDCQRPLPEEREAHEDDVRRRAQPERPPPESLDKPPPPANRLAVALKGLAIGAHLVAKAWVAAPTGGRTLVLQHDRGKFLCEEKSRELD